MFDVLAQVVILSAANYLLVFYMTEPVMGPFDIFHKVRIRAGLKPVYENRMLEGGNGMTQDLVGYESNGRFFADLFNCHKCFSPWAAAGLIVLSWLVGFLSPSLADIVLWLAVAGITIFLLEH